MHWLLYDSLYDSLYGSLGLTKVGKSLPGPLSILCHVKFTDLNNPLTLSFYLFLNKSFVAQCQIIDFEVTFWHIWNSRFHASGSWHFWTREGHRETGSSRRRNAKTPSSRRLSLHLRPTLPARSSDVFVGLLARACPFPSSRPPPLATSFSRDYLSVRPTDAERIQSLCQTIFF